MPVSVSLVQQSQSSNADALAVHRCRFVDYTPPAITAIAFPPLSVPNSRDLKAKLSTRRRKGKFGTLAVGRANGNIELYEWALPPEEQERNPKAPQAWVLSKVWLLRVRIIRPTTCLIRFYMDLILQKSTL